MRLESYLNGVFDGLGLLLRLGLLYLTFIDLSDMHESTSSIRQEFDVTTLS